MNDCKITTCKSTLAFVCRIPAEDELQTGITETKNREKTFAKSLLEYAVREFSSGNTVGIEKNLFGAPTADDLFLSLSHTRFYSFAAVSLSPVGCDAEYVLEGRNFEKLLQRIMTENEKSTYESIIDKKTLFYKLWTAKEASFKRKTVPPFIPNAIETDGVKVFIEDDCCFAIDSSLPFSVRFLSAQNGKFVLKKQIDFSARQIK